MIELLVGAKRLPLTATMAALSDVSGDSWLSSGWATLYDGPCTDAVRKVHHLFVREIEGVLEELEARGRVGMDRFGGSEDELGGSEGHWLS